MKLVQIKLNLTENQFWFLDNINLDSNNLKSSFLNIEEADESFLNSLEGSIRKLRVFAYDIEGNRIKSLAELKIKDGSYDVVIEDTEGEEDDDLNIVSITEEIEEEVPEITEEDNEEAKILLKKNGNSIKRIIKQLENNKENYSMLLAAKEIESSTGSRKKIIECINMRLREFNE